jgi:hypothetical protein
VWPCLLLLLLWAAVSDRQWPPGHYQKRKHQGLEALPGFLNWFISFQIAALESVALE